MATMLLQNLNQLHQHVISLGFDLVSNILETDVVSTFMLEISIILVLL